MSSSLTTAVYHNPVPSMPKGLPDGFDLDSIPFLPNDLQIEPPKKVIVRTTPEFSQVSFPYEENVDMGFGIAYTEPFRILSESGVKKLREAVDREAPIRARGNERTPSCLRGLGYLSTAVREYTESPVLLKLFSKLARQPIGVHPISMNTGHTNISKTGTGYVDQWHVDSVDYVLVLILSDLTDMKGGELQVLNMPDASGKLYDDLKANGVPEELVKSVSYLKAGYGVFMQGSKILHRVKGVLEAREPRISMISSFCNLDVFQTDSTRYHTFANVYHDPDDVHPLEFARHKAWRIEGKMKYILEKCEFGTDPLHLSRVFAEAAEEMQRASRLLSREENDAPGFFNAEPVSKNKN